MIARAILAMIKNANAAAIPAMIAVKIATPKNVLVVVITVIATDNQKVTVAHKQVILKKGKFHE
jgi:hypothetical protein